MVYKKRELRRLWEVEIYDGDREDSDVTTHLDRLVAWNHVDAIRHAGGHVATTPEAICFVTWPDFDGGPIYRVDSPSVGPVGDPITARIAATKVEETNDA